MKYNPNLHNFEKFIQEWDTETEYVLFGASKECVQFIRSVDYLLGNNVLKIKYIVDHDVKDEQGAANAWAGTSGLGIIGALNIKASAGRAPSAYKDLNGICNELAGTTGKSAIDALRSIAS